MSDLAQLPRRRAVDEYRDQVLTIVERHGGRAVSLFGSVARGDENAESDVDFLVTMRDGASLFDIIRMQDALAELLGFEVDVVERAGLKHRDRDILDDAIEL